MAAPHKRSEINDVHNCLKTGTKELHRDAEQSPLLGRLFAADFRQEDYANYLLRTFLFLHPLEAALGAHFPSADLPDFPRRLKSAALVRDLHALEVQGLHQRAMCEALPPLSQASEAFGAMYVVEGSTLGGAVLHKHLSRYEFLPKDSFNYLNVYSGARAGNWRTFLAALEKKAGEDPEYPAQMLASARKTFQLMTAWFRAGD